MPVGERWRKQTLSPAGVQALKLLLSYARDVLRAYGRVSPGNLERLGKLNLKQQSQVSAVPFLHLVPAPAMHRVHDHCSGRLCHGQCSHHR